MLARNNHFEMQRRYTSNNDHGETEWEPLLLFPPEMWTLILADITEAADTLNWTLASPRFADILRDAIIKAVFGLIFPFIVGELSFRDILNCRQVCRQWSSGIDQVLETAHMPTLEEMTRGGTHTRIDGFAPSCPYTFTIPLNNVLQIVRFTLRRIAMESHPRNPFLGRRLSLQMYLETANMRDSVKARVKRVLSEFGQHLFHLKMTISYMTFLPRQLFNLIRHTFNVCKNLKTFHLTSSLITDDEAAAADDLRIDELPLCENLESLHMFEFLPAEQPIQDALIRKHSNQLKTLNFFAYNNDVFKELFCENLKCLEVKLEGPKTSLEGLMTMEAPLLEKLYIHLYAHHSPEFRELMCLLNRFPVLTSCDLTMKNSEFGNDGFLKLEHIPGLVSSKTITYLSLDIRVNRQCTLSFDFLIFFPFLEQLVIEIFEFSPTSSLPSLITAERNKDFIQLGHYIFDECLNSEKVRPISRSNIWQVMSRLQFLKICRSITTQPVPRKITAVYTRSASEA